MPIYEYYCSRCDVRFDHLARRFDEPPPPCPVCGSREVEKMVSVAHRGRSEAERRADYDARAREIDPNDPQAMARFLQKAGSLADEAAPVEPEAFREIVARRAEGAKDEDLQDVVDAIPFPRQTFAPEHEGPHAPLLPLHDHDHDHEHEHGGGEGAAGKRSPRRARHLGWG
ncbi:MAG TPA: hypothetical protein ENK08_02515 [Chloroflexi bacterium]|nr:hypothetical protein [Chloroflexota bacterium]